MPFKKGISGNPGGRPKVLGDVQELARRHTAEAITTLVGIMRDKAAPPAARAMASNAILDRGYGRPAQTVNANITQKPTRDMTDEELMAIVVGADDSPAGSVH
jgi:hypothetical protein